MSSTDARCLSPDAQDALRVRGIEALRNGMKPAEAARTFGISRSSVWNWRKRLELGNIRSLKSRPRGRPRRSRLAGHEARPFPDKRGPG